MTMTNQQTSKPSFWQRLWQAFVNLLKLLVILIVVVGIAAAIIFGAPYLYEKFLQPIEMNAARLTEVENRLTAEIDMLTTQVTALQGRLAELEERQTRSAQALAEYQGRVEVLEGVVDAQGETILQLESIQAQIDELALLSAAHENLLTGEDSPLISLQHQVTISRSIELLSRARLHLIQSNFGMASLDIRAAQELLLAVQPEMSSEKAEQVDAIVARLDMAVSNLPIFPISAINDVDTAWQALVYGLSDPAVEMPPLQPIMPTQTPEPEEEESAPEDEEGEVTPEPEEED
jgi:TolA-binding protein